MGKKTDFFCTILQKKYEQLDWKTKWKTCGRFLVNDVEMLYINSLNFSVRYYTEDRLHFSGHRRYFSRNL